MEARSGPRDRSQVAVMPEDGIRLHPFAEENGACQCLCLFDSTSDKQPSRKLVFILGLFPEENLGSIIAFSSSREEMEHVASLCRTPRIYCA